MAKNNPDKKSLGWFKGTRSNQDEIPEPLVEENKESDVLEESNTLEEAFEIHQQEDTTTNLLTKENQDKVSLDLIVSLENMLKDRQLILYKKSDLENQLQTANETINRLKQDQLKKEQLLEEKSKEILDLESGLTNKQMAYDQLLEDYKEFQNKSNQEYEKISNQLEKEISRYNKLDEESTNNEYINMLKIKDLETKVRNLEIENQKTLEQYQMIVEEKAELMQTINDFTERMSFSFSRKATSESE
ncbi:hypothetical protein [Salirhabdus sp. Marseille-P4669]|uniref:hypothetical protein n=1 Tax=Salirhabdus sp. Marseille-P4669 TaxID=2042310 RepID=UPI000C7D28A9|nr:hypothetical protein [Salirhabdus sp. Marseille-P4669]